MGLYVLGLPYAPLWSISAIFQLLPYAGSAMAAMAPAMLALAVYESPYICERPRTLVIRKAHEMVPKTRKRSGLLTETLLKIRSFL